jgi:hypothetical protein
MSSFRLSRSRVANQGHIVETALAAVMFLAACAHLAITVGYLANW